MKFINLVVSIIVLFAFSSCLKIDDGLSVEQEVVFQFEYINHAWGKVHHGFFVTTDGSIYKYNNPEKWVFPEKDIISIDDFSKNIGYATEKIGTVDLQKLNEIRALVGRVDADKLAEGRFAMADAGSETYSFYLKNEIKQNYQKVLLLSRGDYYQRNTDTEAEVIALWLVALNNGGMFSDQFFK